MSRSAPRAWLAAALAGWLLGGPTGSVQAAGDATEPAVHRVVIDRFAFEPQRLELRPSDIVEWTNRDLAPHTASAESGDWDSGELSRGGVFRQRFSAEGTAPYFCAFHPHMRGEITVAAP